ATGRQLVLCEGSESFARPGPPGDEKYRWPRPLPAGPEWSPDGLRLRLGRGSSFVAWDAQTGRALVRRSFDLERISARALIESALVEPRRDIASEQLRRLTVRDVSWSPDGDRVMSGTPDSPPGVRWRHVWDATR